MLSGLMALLGLSCFMDRQGSWYLEYHRSVYLSPKAIKIIRQVVKFRSFNNSIGCIWMTGFQRVGPVKVCINAAVNYFVAFLERTFGGIQIREQIVAPFNSNLVPNDWPF